MSGALNLKVIMNRLVTLILGFMGLRKLDGKDSKSAAEWGFLLSALFIVPLFFLPHASELIKIGLQLLWGAAFRARHSWPTTAGSKTNHAERLQRDGESIMLMHELFKQVRGQGRVMTTITQSADMFKGNVRRRRPAFDEWVRKLHPGDRLPRGCYFRDKKPGLPFLLMDEFWIYNQ